MIIPDTSSLNVRSCPRLSIGDLVKINIEKKRASGLDQLKSTLRFIAGTKDLLVT